jgi:hypothetical protein
VSKKAEKYKIFGAIDQAIEKEVKLNHFVPIIEKTYQIAQILVSVIKTTKIHLKKFDTLLINCRQ